MGDLSRRAFLGRSTAVAAAAGIGAMAPVAIGSLAGGGGADGAAVDGVGADLSGLAQQVDGPIVAHIRDLATGEIGIFNGVREFVIHDAALASRLAGAVR